jgi:hypothetical protein
MLGKIEIYTGLMKKRLTELADKYFFARRNKREKEMVLFLFFSFTLCEENEGKAC